MNNDPMYMEYVDDADEQPARRRGWRVLGWVSVGVSAVMVAGALTSYGVYRNALSNMAKEDVNAAIGPNRPKKLNSAMNILIIGSDTREGSNAKYGRRMQNELPRSDTMILLHLSPGGGSALGITFPRDLMVPLPSCRTRDGGRSAPQSRGQINSTFTTGGASCVIRTIESISQIKIDHFVEINFTGVKQITSAIGGVPVCLPKPVNDSKAKLRLPAGKQVLKGEKALGYVRLRYGLGDGSDTDRIKRQQRFIGALANKTLSKGTLSNPSKMLPLINAVSKSIKTDTELTPDVMVQLAGSMQGISSGKIRFVTAPSGPDPMDTNRVALTQDADPFFSSVRNDKTPPAETKPGSKTTPKIPATQVRVRVYNGSGINGQAGRVMRELEARGFQVELGGNATSATPATKVMYGAGADQHALTLNGIIPDAKPPVERANGVPGKVDLVIGRDWPGLKNSQAGIPKQKGEVRADDDICKEA
ncbi:LCP family protein [Actinomadura flavalba]|uniref:LCP family protein n=1 Tax=Actinomadura flavalba TaxID=1120938 RepID=UPI0003766DC0|nr:LCP family protein [Actinomadura flavalba]